MVFYRPTASLSYVNHFQGKLEKLAIERSALNINISEV